MGKTRTPILRVSITELLASILGESYAPREIVEENRLIHHRLGLDEAQEYSIVLGGLEGYDGWRQIDGKPLLPQAFKPICLTFKPDAVRDNMVYELKVLRRYSDRDRLILHGFLQLQLELYALGLDHGKLIVYKLDSGEVEEIDVDVDPSIALEIIALYLDMLTARRRLIERLINESKIVKL